jgi:hypothetical protein
LPSIAYSVWYSVLWELQCELFAGNGLPLPANMGPPSPRWRAAAAPSLQPAPPPNFDRPNIPKKAVSLGRDPALLSRGDSGGAPNPSRHRRPSPSLPPRRRRLPAQPVRRFMKVAAGLVHPALPPRSSLRAPTVAFAACSGSGMGGSSVASSHLGRRRKGAGWVAGPPPLVVGFRRPPRRIRHPH